MALIDSNFEFADSVSIAAAAGTYVAGTKDFGAANSRPNSGRNVYLQIMVEETVTSGGAATVQFRLMSGAASPIVPASDVQHWGSKLFAYTELTAGKRITVPLPGGIAAYGRYVGIAYTIGTATTTAGKINAYLEFDGEGWEAMPDGI